MIDPKPLTKEERAQYEREATLPGIQPEWRADIQRLLDVDRYWREIVNKADAPRCPWTCDPSVRIDVFWTQHPERHAPDCPWLLAQP